MKKRYTFLAKNWLRFGLLAAFAGSLSFSASAQNGPAIQWDKTFGTIDTEYFRCLQQTSDGGYILGGNSDADINGDKTQPSRGMVDFWIIKLDANGNKLWDKSFGGNDNDEIRSLQQTTDGGYILAGVSSSSISGDKSQALIGGTDYWIIKLDASGNKQWDKTFGSTNDDELLSVKQISNGGYILGGYSNGNISGDKSQANNGTGPYISSDYWVVKLDVNGNKIWDKTFGGGDEDLLTTLQTTSDGGYFLGGQSSSNISGDKSQNIKGSADYWVVKLDANGNKLWDKTFGGDESDYLTSLQQTIDGGYILGGTSYSGLSGDKSQGKNGSNCYWVIKLDHAGNKIWDKSFSGNNTHSFKYVQQTSDGGYILGGESDSGITIDKTQPSKGMGDYWIIKLDSIGNKVWDKTIGGNSLDRFFSLQQTSDRGYILGGWSLSKISGDKTQASKGLNDFWIVKLAADVTGIKEPETTFAVSISPNPNQGKFTLQLSNLTASKAEVTVSDLLGRTVLQQPLTVSNKQISEELTLPQAKGMYLLQVKVGEQISTRKIVVE